MLAAALYRITVWRYWEMLSILTISQQQGIDEQLISYDSRSDELILRSGTQADCVTVAARGQ
jgi:hypothetical protein